MGAPHPGAAGAPQPTPVRIFETINAFQQAAAVRAAIELDLFTAIGEGNHGPAELGRRCGASERGMRILCDYLSVAGLLNKNGGGYQLAPDTAMFLDRSSPAYMGSAVRFLHSAKVLEAFDHLTEAVRKGGTALRAEGLVEAENPEWVEFARSMAPLQQLPSEWIAGIVEAETAPGRPLRVLDVAAGHGLFGIAVARRLPQAVIVAVDWPNVLEVARENAANRGVAGRYRTLPGDAFSTDFGGGYDVALITNFLHHFDLPACAAFLRKVRGALKPRGCAVVLEFVPNEDRVSPPMAAAFPLIMLAITPSGDAYTFEQYRRLFEATGFTGAELKAHPVFPGQVVLARA